MKRPSPLRGSTHFGVADQGLAPLATVLRRSAAKTAGMNPATRQNGVALFASHVSAASSDSIGSPITLLTLPSTTSRYGSSGN